MNKISFLVMLVVGMLALASSSSAGACQAQYMHDPCELDGYAIVESEKYIAGKHNHMDSVHDLDYIRDGLEKTRKVKRYYVKRCKTSVRYR